MSWDQYVSQSLMCPLDSEGRTLTSAAIVGHDGAIWAASATFPDLTAAEAATILAAFEGSSVSTFTIGGSKYLRVQGDDTVLRGKFLRPQDDESVKAGGCTISKTAQTLVIGVWNEPVPAGSCNKVVESMGDYLTNSGY